MTIIINDIIIFNISKKILNTIINKKKLKIFFVANLSHFKLIYYPPRLEDVERLEGTLPLEYKPAISYQLLNYFLLRITSQYTGNLNC